MKEQFRLISIIPYGSTQTNHQAISREEANYWKTQLQRIIRIGAEFEYNLPTKFSCFMPDKYHNNNCFRSHMIQR